MNKKEFEKLLKKNCAKEIAELEMLIKGGAKSENLIKNENIDRALLSLCNVPCSYLVPTKKPTPLSSDDWDSHIPQSNFEFFNGVPFDVSGYSRDALIMALVTSVGLEYFVELLPDKSKKDLSNILSRNANRDEFHDTLERVLNAGDLEELLDARDDLLKMYENDH